MTVSSATRGLYGPAGGSSVSMATSGLYPPPVVDADVSESEVRARVELARTWSDLEGSALIRTLRVETRVERTREAAGELVRTESSPVELDRTLTKPSEPL